MVYGQAEPSDPPGPSSIPQPNCWLEPDRGNHAADAVLPAANLQLQKARQVHSRYQGALCVDQERPGRWLPRRRCRPMYGEPCEGHWLGRQGRKPHHRVLQQGPACEHGWTTRLPLQANAVRRGQDYPGW